MVGKIELKENERIDDLEYRGLKLIQNVNWFCFGVDSVLLSDFSKKIKKNAEVLDIGSGTGIISILLSKKTNAKKITGIEIQTDVAEMSRRSVILNNLEDKVTNPPYQKNNTGLKSENEKQLISRTEIECTLEDIIEKSYKVLKDRGEFYMVHRPERLVDIMYLLRKNRMEPKILRFVYPKIGEKSNLILIKAVKNANKFLKLEKPLIIYNLDGSYTDEVLKIYEKNRYTQ